MIASMVILGSKKKTLRMLLKIGLNTLQVQTAKLSLSARPIHFRLIPAYTALYKAVLQYGGASLVYVLVMELKSYSIAVLPRGIDHWK